MASVREMAQAPGNATPTGPPSHQAMMAMLKAGVPPPHAANLMSHCYQMAEKWWGVGLLSPGAQDTNIQQQPNDSSSNSHGKIHVRLGSVRLG